MCVCVCVWRGEPSFSLSFDGCLVFLLSVFHMVPNEMSDNSVIMGKTSKNTVFSHLVLKSRHVLHHASFLNQGKRQLGIEITNTIDIACDLLEMLYKVMLPIGS